MIGPNANSHWAMLGDYTYQALHAFFESGKIDKMNPKLVTLKEGMERVMGEGASLAYERGCDWDKTIKTEIKKGGDSRIKLSKLDILVNMLREEADPTSETNALSAARSSDVIVLAMGENAALCGEGRMRKGIRLPGHQEKFVESMIDTGKPVVLVLFGGRAQVLSRKILDGASAIVQAWYPGQQGGNAVADILFGKVNPSGKLCTSYPATESKKPLSYNYGEKAMEGLVEFPFGYGLSYTSFKYDNIKVSPKAEIGKDIIEVSFTLTNVGKVAGSEIAQLYFSPTAPSANYKPIQLKGYEKVKLEAGESKRVTFQLSTESLAYYDCDRAIWITEAGDFLVKVASSSKDIELSAPLSLTGKAEEKELRDYYFSQSSVKKNF